MTYSEILRLKQVAKPTVDFFRYVRFELFFVSVRWHRSCNYHYL